MQRLFYQFGSNNRAKIPAEPSISSPSAEPTGTVLQGLQVVSEGIDPVVDIVAVHGLNGDREKTWTASSGVNWLRDLLPQDLPNARIISWGYDANTHRRSGVSCQYLFDHARTLVSDLCLERQVTQTSRRPIIFVAHSLGGIIVKSALIHSDAARRGALEEHRSIKLSTYGVMFMGTPHQGGSGVALGRLMVNVASVFVAADDRLLQHLERDSEWLQQQLGQYGPISSDFVTKFAFEEYATPTVLGQSFMVVPRASAVVPGVADGESIVIHADHINMVKFGSKSDPGYKTVSGHLRVMAANAGDAIGRRWDTEGRVDAVRSNGPIESFTVKFSVPEVSPVEHFVSRDEELDRIHKELQHGGSRKIVVVHGLGGMGKTQLALAYAKQHRDEYSAVFWVNSKDIDTLKQGYVAAAKRIFRDHPSLVHLKSIVDGGNLDEAMEAVKRWLNNSQNDRWLIIYDNYDTPKLLGCDGAGTFDIRPFLPEAHQGAIVITTRSSQLRLGHLVAVKKLQNIEHSLEILSHASGRVGLSSDPDAYELARELDGLPLALATAGAYLYQMSTSFAEYLRLYKESWLRLQQKTPQLLSYEDRALYSTWEISLDHVKRQSSLAARLLQLWAYFDNQDVWFELLQQYRRDGPEWFSELTQDQLSFDEAVRVLCDHALVEADSTFENNSVESRGYSMHSCVHSWTVHVVNDRWDDRMARLALRCVGLHVPARDWPQYWVIEQRLIRHANRCCGFISSGLTGQDDDVSTLGAIHGLGLLHRDLGKLDEAEEMYKRALEGREKTLGPEHTSTLHTVNNLGTLYWDQDKLDEAEKMYRRALEGCKKALGPEHTWTLCTVNNLGTLYTDQGELDEAEKMFQWALEGYEKAFGPHHTSTLDTVNNFGGLYAVLGKLDEAEKMYRRALEGCKKALGPEHTWTLCTVNNLGNLYVDQGEMDEAEKMFQWALEGYEKAFGPHHMSTLGTANNLGTLYWNQGKLDEAEKMYRRALEGFKKALGLDHTLIFHTVNNLGNLYVSQGEMDKAEKMFQWALEGYKKTLGTYHTSTLSTVNNLGTLYGRQGKLDEAEEMYRRALDGFEKRLGYEHKRCRRLRHTLDTFTGNIATN
ncbi:TPR-like protein [Byssothecium circinans]|uniref:TPR-like protein n=1 Tax=Byssothecium circinans TaxID=147558 RepID=A0A6A5TUY4_9PLEO|nr:TPR-like protein [Byssothecium circinans]